METSCTGYAKGTSETGASSLYSLQGQNLQVAAIDVPCPWGADLCGLVPVAKAIKVLQSLPENTGCKHGPGKTARTWFGHLVQIGGTFVAGNSLRITCCVA